MQPFLIILFLASSVPAALGCQLKYDPVSAPHFYRDQGWYVPGTVDEGVRSTDHYYGLVGVGGAPGVKGVRISHSDPYIVTLPEQEFRLEGKLHRIQRQQFKAQVIRWEIDGNVFAYSYSLIPVTAHREKDKWIITGEVGCIFAITFVDDRGDGVFRLLVPNGLTADLIPGWAKPKES